MASWGYGYGSNPPHDIRQFPELLILIIWEGEGGRAQITGGQPLGPQIRGDTKRWDGLPIEIAPTP